MSRLIAIDWEADDLTGVDADVLGDGVRVRQTFNLVWPEGLDPAEDRQAAGQWLAESLKKSGVTASEAVVVLPREAVVVRRLDLPNAPDDELPDIVRFQAATKSSTPLDRLVLDYLPLPVAEGDTTRQVLMVTVDSKRLQTIQQVLTSAELNLQRVGVSSVAVAELVTRIDGEHSANPHQATLVVFQDTHRVEITILQESRVVFTHQTRLISSDDAQGIKASISEINRASIALTQSDHDVEITEVCLVQAGDADPALEEALADRFGGQLHVLDIAKSRGVTVDNEVDRAVLNAFAPAVGVLLSQESARVPAIDFLHPRKKEEAPDNTKFKLGVAAAGLLLAGGLGYGMFSSHITRLDEQIFTITGREAELKRELKAGAPELKKAAGIRDWIDGGRDPLAVLNELHQLGPGHERLYLKEYEQSGGLRGTIARISGLGYAKTPEDVETLLETLEQAGYRVLPNVTSRSRVDPDYPYEFRVELQILPPQKIEKTS